MILCGAAFVGAACTDSTEYDNTNVRPIDGLIYPTNGSTVELYLYSEAKTNFEWKKSSGTQMYSVVFYASDKRTELATYLADNNGMNNSLQVPHANLSAIAERAGIAAGKSGDVYWNVTNNAGAHSAIGSTPSKLTLARYKSALEKPYRLYITGEGSEGGADFTQALPMKNNGNSFMIYTKIKGNVSFVNRNEEGNKMTIGFNEEREFTYGDDAFGTMPEGVYRVTVNFQQSEVKFEKINSLKMVLGGGNDRVVDEFAYTGKGVWTSSAKVTIRHNGQDDRYRFLASVDAGQEIWGSKEGRDANEPETILATDDYYTLYLHGQDVVDDSYGRIFKFYTSRLNDEQAVVSVHMTPERLYHEFTLDFPLTEVPVVSTFTTPAADQKLMLSSTPGAESEFKWEVPAGNAPQLKLTSYKVFFSTDAAGKEVIGMVSADWNSSVNIKHTDLEGFAAAAGIAPATSGEVYWTVQTSVEGNTAMATTTRKVILRRFVSMPTVAYITGAGSEYAANYGKMHIITDEGKDKGKFEIYVSMTQNGKFDLTTDDDPSADAYTKFEFKSLVTGGAIVENGNADNSFTPATGIYRLVVDFNADTIGIQKVENMRFVSAVVSGEPVALDYRGNGVWGKDNFIPKFRGGWDDDRFFFFADYDAEKTKLGWHQTSDGELDYEPQPGDSRYWIYFTHEMSDWDYHLHCLKSYRANTTKKVNMDLHMNGNATCSHPFLYVNYLEK